MTGLGGQASAVPESRLGISKETLHKNITSMHSLLEAYQKKLSFISIPCIIADFQSQRVEEPCSQPTALCKAAASVVFPSQLDPFHAQVRALMWLLARKINQVNSSLVKQQQSLIVNFLSPSPFPATYLVDAHPQDEQKLQVLHSFPSQTPEPPSLGPDGVWWGRNNSDHSSDTNQGVLWDQP